MSQPLIDSNSATATVTESNATAPMLFPILDESTNMEIVHVINAKNPPMLLLCRKMMMGLSGNIDPNIAAIGSLRVRIRSGK